MNGTIKKPRTKTVSLFDRCAVCDSKADGIHFGAVSCRSCNAFFRRAVTLRQKFICRQSKNCPLKGIRCACRACRYQKCTEVGMDKQLVQPPRDPTGKRTKRHSTSSSISSNFGMIKDLSISNNNASNNGSQFNELSSDSNSDDILVCSPSPFVDSCTSVSPSMSSDISSPTRSSSVDCDLSILFKQRKPSPIFKPVYFDIKNDFDRLVFYYREHLEMMNSCLFSMDDYLKGIQRGQETRKANFHDIKRLKATEMNGFFYWLEKLDLSHLIEINDRKKICQRYFMRKISLDRCYIASRNPDFVEKGCLAVLGNTFIPSHGTDVDVPTPNEDIRRAKETLLNPTMIRLWDAVVVPFTKMQITDAEIVALQVLLLCSSNQSVNERTKLIIERRRSSTIARLFEFYERNDIPNPEIRFGEILLLLPELQIICDQRRQDYEIAQLLKLSHFDENLSDIF